MRKLDLVKKRKEPSIKLEVDQEKQLEALAGVKDSVDSLFKAISEKEDYDFEKLAKGLSVIADKIDDGADLKTYIESLGENLKGLKPLSQIEVKGHDLLLKAINNNQPQMIERSKLGASQRTIRGTSPTVIVPGASGASNDVYGIILANSTDDFTQIIIKDGQATRFVFSLPARETRGFTVFPLGAHKQTTAGESWTASGDRSGADVDITTFWLRGQ